MKNHDQNLIAMLEKARKTNFKLNPAKIRFKTREARIIGQDKINVDPAKVTVITKMPVPHNVAELQRFLGMVHYLFKSLPKLSDLTASLMRKEVTMQCDASESGIGAMLLQEGKTCILLV